MSLNSNPKKQQATVPKELVEAWGKATIGFTFAIGKLQVAEYRANKAEARIREALKYNEIIRIYNPIYLSYEEILNHVVRILEGSTDE